ncbi:MAG TPA: cardiolipin synthase ClsB [Burkholderiales bacterium]
MARPYFVPGNRLTLLRNGAEFFPALEAAIDGATREVHLQTYIFRADGAGTRIAEAMKRAAARGVAVRLLIDGFGSSELPEKFAAALREAGVSLLYFRPDPSRWQLKRNRLRRMHRKVAVADGRVAFIGGINIEDDIQPGGPPAPRFDFAVAVEGPLVAPIHHMARRLWGLVAWSQLRRRQAVPVPPASTALPGDQRSALVRRDNLRHRQDIERAYLDAIAAARSEVLIANAYFLPGRRFRRALVEARQRGARVVLLLQGRVEYALQHYATRALYGSLLAAGVEIHEYQKSYLHAKVACVDQRWATVGSSNIDPFSLLLAREANIVVDHEGFAGELREDLLRAIREDSEPVHGQRWREEPLRDRVLSWLAYGAVRWIMGVAGYGYHDEPLA